MRRFAGLRRFLFTIRVFVLLLVRPSRRAFYGTLFVTSTEGDSFERAFLAFAATPAGARLLEQKPDSGAILADRERLAACPQGSLGRLYGQFMRENGLDESYYQNDPVCAVIRNTRDPSRAWFRSRVAMHHDLYHVLTGYPASGPGEACLMSFRYPQIRHRGVLTLALTMMIANLFRPYVLVSMWDAYRRGRRAINIELLPWEECLERPLAAVRAQLGIVPPRFRGGGYAPGAYASQAELLAFETPIWPAPAPAAAS